MKRTLLAVGIMVVVLLAGNAQAILTDLGNGLVYDSVNNISWTKDADISGVNTWANQNTFAANLELAGFSDFRLASIDELASLYSQLPGAAGSNKTGAQGPFVDIQSDYWSATPFAEPIILHFLFENGTDFIAGESSSFWGWAVRPGDSVGVVPEPGTAMLLGLGLLGMGVSRRWRGW